MCYFLFKKPIISIDRFDIESLIAIQDIFSLKRKDGNDENNLIHCGLR